MVRRYSLARDHWGYYNGSDTQTSLLPNNIISGIDGNSFNGGANRSPNVTKMDAWVLTGITYPTRGRTEFNYEPHLDPNDNVTPIGGLRIQSIRRYNSGTNTPAYESTYNYLQGIYFPGLITSTQSNYVYDLMPLWTGPPPTNVTGGNNTYSGGYTGGGENGWEPCDAGEMYSSSILAPMSTSQGNHIAYNLVDVTDENEGFSRFQYNNFVPFNTLTHFYHPFPPPSIKVGSGELRATTYYDISNTPVASESVTFDLIEGLESIPAIKIQTYNSYCGSQHFSDHSLKHTYTIDISRIRRTTEISTKDGVSVTTNNF